MNKLSFGWKHYFAPTPKRFRVLGDSLAAAGTFGASIVILNGQPVAGTVIMIVAIIGKFLSNFFTEEPTSDK
jgi:chloramphenicol 3-O-phosphotransferase